MNTHLQHAKDTLFGEAGLRASNFKLFPGNARDASAEQVAGEIVQVLKHLEAGTYEVVADVNE